MKKILHLIRKRLPARWQHHLRRQFAAPAGYREMIRRADRVEQKKAQGGFVSDLETRLFDLRRVAHIREKGLLHPEWEPEHGRNDYLDLCRALEDMDNCSSAPLQDPTYKWAVALKEEYEQAQEQGAVDRPSPEEESSIITAVLVERFIKARRSVRSFKQQPVPVDAVEKIVEAMNWSPTSCNRQPAVVYVAHTVSSARECMKHFKGATGISEYVPCFMVFCADMRGYSYPAERLLPAIDVSLGMQSAALVAHGHGLSMTILSWAQHSVEEDTALRDIFNIPDYHEIIAGALCGYPAVSVEAPARKSIATTIRMLPDEHPDH